VGSELDHRHVLHGGRDRIPGTTLFPAIFGKDAEPEDAARRSGDA
jgi:hypothetical protein